MAWSTSQLAELAGTTVKAVRHYHSLGLLDEPERRSNGYKQYQVAHLIRLLQITRLAELGVPLAQIATMGRADEEPEEALRVLDAELEASIAKLERIRGELALILRHRAPADLPSRFTSIADKLSPTDRSIIMLMSRVLDDDAMEDIRRMTEERTAIDDEFDAVTAETPETRRREIAAGLAERLTRTTAAHPWLGDPGSRAPRGSAFAERAVAAIGELYNRAQLEVLYRAHLISEGDEAKLAELDAAIAVSRSEHGSAEPPSG
ncbi:MerR family transcriptional regulator [Homoserinibacter sp. YIM 151385]|uniref:MerR family transcriptional regulator n=1 Tax=Homoserinibacter sp. YIM 151385 TaxID=2985506 RepID=UPI0022F10EE6|nr:MerR family transcriptional regulator [Homoserinibacter sp. YIM 151385]WBU38002.1 MerR family DNA-binding transcriptional regulator [Homoserinibacter sp. YIM 151385]